MIKCYILQSTTNETPEGSFNENKFYIAKVSANKPNSLTVLDNKQNWVHFKYFTRTQDYRQHHLLYFVVIDTFFVKDKKELNEYIPTTKFYNQHNK